MRSKLDARSLVDQVIEENIIESQEKDALFEEFAKGVLKAVPGGSKILANEGVIGIVSKNVQPECKRLISWAILRYLGCVGHFPIKPPNLRPKLIKYIEVEIGKEIEKAHSIIFTEQSYIVESKLSKIVPSIEKEFLESANYTGLPNIKDFFEQTQKSLNKNQNAALFFTFIDKKTINAVLANVYSSVISFLESIEEKNIYTLEEFNNAIQACDVCIDEFSKLPNKYTKHLEKHIRKIKESVNAKMEDLKLSEPANLSVMLEPKKYPLHVAGAKLQIRIQVKNIGEGNAFNCCLEFKNHYKLSILNKNIQLGNLYTNESRIIYINAELLSPQKKTHLNGNVSWINFDRSQENIDFELKIERQDPGIDWAALELKQPYSQDIATGDNFFGRERLLKKLLPVFLKSNPGSAFLWGQKRVGKTSLSKMLEKKLLESSSLITVAYIETIHDVTAQDTINRMCAKLIALLKKDNKTLSHISAPKPTGTLSQLGDFLEEATLKEPDRKFIIILDEFDELPLELYKARGIADAFFQTLGKGIAAKRNVGVLLVGGERIPLIIREQGMRLNMYKSERIDYFDRDTEWDAFLELVCRPGAPLEFSPEAIKCLWDYSAGNPYFLNEIASRVAQMMIDRRDAHITYDEIVEGIRRTLDEMDINSFAHYWEDGITAVDDSDFLSQRSERVRFLLSFADALRIDNTGITNELIKKHAITYRCTSQDIERQIRSFQDRGIIISNREEYIFRVRLFQEWLKEKGYLNLTEIVATELHLAEKLDKEKSEAITGTEIRELLENWGPYKGKLKTESEVRDWLKQFGGNQDQRLMLKLLQNIKFYSDDIVRDRFEQAHKSILGNIITIIKKGERTRRDIVVTYLGSPGKSGPSMQRLYRQVNRIHSDLCLSPDDVHSFIKENEEIAALVFVDDFVGTGKTATELFNRLINVNPDLRDLLESRGIRIWYITIAGSKEGLRKIEEIFENNFSQASYVIAADEIDDKGKAFSKTSEIWSSEEERIVAQEIVESLGKRLEPRAPLGFGNLQSLVVFEENCPNNTLPILYKESKSFKSFRPLFLRS